MALVKTEVSFFGQKPYIYVAAIGTQRWMTVSWPRCAMA